MRAILVAALVAGCSGGSSGGEEGTPCGSQEDCRKDLGCVGPNDGPVCGVAPNEQCATDINCSNGNRCHAVFDACSPDSVGSECKPPCATDPECGEGFRCSAGACVAAPCDVSPSCARRQVCDPSRITDSLPVHARHHGCFETPCTDDVSCGQRFCVNGFYQETPGHCDRPMLVP